MNKIRHISGFDYLRAFFSVLVVVWHSQGISFLIQINSYLQYVVNIFYYNICLLAVPIFFSISLFLWYKKQLTGQGFFFTNRISNLLLLYCSWIVIRIAFNSALSQGEYLSELIYLNKFLKMLVTGANSELFFLFSLITLSLFAFINGKYFLNKRNSLYIQLILLACSLLIFPLVCFLTLVTHVTAFSAFWNPLCFIPYIFSSLILVLVDNNNFESASLSSNSSKKIFFLLLFLFSVFLFLSYLEWKVFNYPQVFGYLLPPYARISLVIGSFIICFCAILYKNKSPTWICKLSQESLGLYLLHGYVLFAIDLLISRKSFELPFEIIIFNPINKVIIIVAISTFLSKLLKQYKIGKIMLNSRAN